MFFMNKVFKKVLIYLGVGAFGAMVGIGALIGVSSCAYKQDNNTQQKAKAQPKGKLLTGDMSQILGNNKLYYFVAKHYDSSGAGVFWRQLGPSHTIDNANYSSGMPFPDISTSDLTSDLTFTVLSEDAINSDMSVLRFWLSNYNGSNILVGVTYYNENFSRSVGLFGLGQNDGSYFNRNHASFSCTQLHASNSGVLTLISSLFNVYEVGEQTFSFTNNFNYYSTYAQDIDTFFVNESYFNDNTHLMKSVDVFSGVPFYSGGYVFDTIRFWYGNAYGLYYKDGSVLKQWTSYGFATFEWVEYVNSVTNLTKAVYQRILTSEQNSDATIMAYNLGGKWISDYYKELLFFEDINNIQVTNLSKFNNSSFSGGIGLYVSSGDIGLGSVFTLLSQAFTAWTPIFAIQIVPGITIGLLLFLPLIAGVIVLIIWVVKR